MRYEKSEEGWTEYTTAELIAARIAVCEYLCVEHRHTISNTDLCELLHLPTDVFRPQRLIKWSNEAKQAAPKAHEYRKINS